MNHHIRRSMLSVKVLLFLCIDFSSSWLELAFPSGTQLPSDTAYSSALAQPWLPPPLSLPPPSLQHPANISPSPDIRSEWTEY